MDKCDGLLVVGTSLEVYSAYKFVHRVNTLSTSRTSAPIPIAIINMGETRAERMKIPGIVYKSEANCVTLLQAALAKL